MTAAAAIVSTTLCTIGVAAFLFAHRINTCWVATETNAAAAILATVLAGFMFIFGGAPLLFLNPVIAGYLIAVGVLLFAYGFMIERQPVGFGVTPDPAQEQALLNRIHAGETVELGVTTADLDRAFRWNAGPTVYRYPADHHRRRHGGPR
jgi:hypothetical protein